MSGKKIITFPSDSMYVYNGSMAGFLCCVHESVYKKQLPSAIVAEAEVQPSLLPQIYIETDKQKAIRVHKSIPGRISNRALELVETVFLSCLPEKELCILQFLLLGYEQGAKTPNMLGHPLVNPLIKAEKHLHGEAHLLTGFIRFSDYDGILAATITPKNYVLPYLVKHFVGRYSGESFMIFDKTHKSALLYQNRKARIVQMDHIAFPQASPTEEKYRALWKQFYNTIAIEARTNPKCRMTHMPKRYWENMLEVQDLL